VRYQYGQSRGRLSPLLFLSALALVVGVLGGCGSSDSGQDVQPEPEAAGTSQCPTKSDAGKQAAKGVDWRGCDLTGANLGGADLVGAYLTGANLSGSDLIGADLSGSDLTGADLSGADLRRTDLSGANLRDANLSGSDLTDANLRYADLNGADLTGASLTGARCNDRTSWPDGTTGHGSTCPG
jgi:uncharacterized protein YjbI with pentapeptide repeats